MHELALSWLERLLQIQPANSPTQLLLNLTVSFSWGKKPEYNLPLLLSLSLICLQHGNCTCVRERMRQQTQARSFSLAFFPAPPVCPACQETQTQVACGSSLGKERGATCRIARDSFRLFYSIHSIARLERTNPLKRGESVVLERFSPIPVSLIGLQLTPRELPEWIFRQGYRSGSDYPANHKSQITNHQITKSHDTSGFEP